MSVVVVPQTPTNRTVLRPLRTTCARVVGDTQRQSGVGRVARPSVANMSGSGLIYAAVLAAWAAYFVSRSVRSGSRELLVAPEGTVLRRRGATEAPAGSYA